MKLRELAERDRAVVADLLANRDLQHLLLAYPPDAGTADVDAWMARRIGEADLFFRAVADEMDVFCGFVQISHIHFRGRFGWLGMAIVPSRRQKGLGRQALRELMRYARQDLQFRKILLEVRADNAPASNLYRSEGFRDVGTLRQHYFDGRTAHDVLLMESDLNGVAA